MHLYEVLRRPLVTEKNAIMQMEGKYAFEVAKKSTKPQIKQAVETAFSVRVTAVNVMTVHGKERRMGNRHVRTSPWRKAIVTLQVGDKIELFENV